MSKHFSRRNFLKSVAASSLALPVLPSLMPQKAQAQAGVAPLRFVALISRNGQFDDLYYPNLAVNDATEVGGNLQVRSKRLADIAGDISPVFHSAFDPVREKMSLLRGLDVCSNRLGHNRTTPLTGSNTTGNVYAVPTYKYSIDHVISEHVYTSEPARRALRLSSEFNSRTYDNSWSWDGSDTRLPVQGDLEGVLNSLFTGVGETTIDPLTGHNSQIVDRLFARYKSSTELKRMASADKQRLEQYFVQLKRAQESVAAVRNACEVPSLQGVLDASRTSNEVVFDAAFDLIGGAFACDLSRVAVLDMTHAHDSLTDESWHASSHFPRVTDSSHSLGYNGWLGTRVANFLNHLDSLIDVDGNTVLDNTVVLWTNELSWGNSHAVNGMPVMMAGGGAKFRLGEYIDFRQHGAGELTTDNLDTKAVGLPYNQLLISIMEAMGLGPSEYEQEGMTGFGDYEAIGDQQAHYNALFGNRRATLPYFVR